MLSTSPRFEVTVRYFIIGTCAACLCFCGGCGSDDGASNTGKPKYEVASDSESGSDGAGDVASPPTLRPSSGQPFSGQSAPKPPPVRPSAGSRHAASDPAAPRAPATSPGGAGGGSAPMPGGASNQTPPPQPPSTPPSNLNPYAVKGTTPEQLMEFIDSMMRQAQRPAGATMAEQSSNLQNILTSVVEAAEKILAQKADDETLRLAAEAKVACLTQLAVMGAADAQDKLSSFCDELAQHESAELSRLGQRMRFAYQMDAFSQGASDDAPAMVAEFKKLFAGESKDERTLSFTTSVVSVFEQRGYSDAALQVLKSVADAYAGTTDPQLASAVNQLHEQMRLIENKIREKFNAYQMKQPGSVESLMASLDVLLQGEPRGEQTWMVVSRIATELEQTNPAEAAILYQKLAAAFKDHSDLGERAASTSEKFAKRSAILNQPFVIQGVKLNGTPFDWSQYAGKVVLVDFWETQCLPCLQEIPNIAENLKQYQGQGFEVVSVNLDEDRERVRQLLSGGTFPWTVVVSADPASAGAKNPNAVKYGVAVESLPFNVLVGRDGKAIEVNLFGDALGAKLAEIFPAP